jgi:hypothetical protein
MRLVELECTLGVTIKGIQDSGRIIKCTEKATYGGQTAKNTLETLVKIKDMVMVNLDGKMVVNTKENG